MALTRSAPSELKEQDDSKTTSEIESAKRFNQETLKHLFRRCLGINDKPKLTQAIA